MYIYHDSIRSFGSCQHLRPLQNVHEFLTQPIWFNSAFISKGTTMCLRNWIESGFLWVKDLYDENGCFLSSNDIFNKLKDKRNWMSEYCSVRKSVERVGDKFGEIGRAHV